ncbi:helix-turn-helix domain-containing protein [Nocardia sp. NPDC004151]|uniref:helix-turn-helix domain-containing protein n=1 Tax=Nocardia sp. NPDC004151 TaxID=3364304 RepID=UPI0036C9915E
MRASRGVPAPRRRIELVEAWMAVVFDTAALARHERADALAAVASETVAAADVRFADRGGAHGRLEAWLFGPVEVLRAETTGVDVLRTPKHVRTTPAGLFSVTRQIGGTRIHEHFGIQEVLAPGDCGAIDHDNPFVSVMRGASISVSLRMSVDELELPGDVVRTAALGLRRSPLCPLVSSFIVDLMTRADTIENDPGAADLGRAGVDMVRALVLSAAGTEPVEGIGAGLPAPLLLRQMETYLRLNLRRRDLTAAEVAAAHHISVRRMYRLWSEQGVSMQQWIIGERLELTRRMLADPRHTERTIGWIARAAGFRDASHFTRRFRAAYGVGPSEWRAEARRVGGSVS